MRVETPVHPTENPEKVIRALRNLFPDLQIESTKDRIGGTTANLDRLREMIRNQRIRDTARRQLVAGRRENRTTVSVSKQAAFVGVVNFAIASPLGDIAVEIESDDIEAAIDYIAESTVAPKA